MRGIRISGNYNDNQEVRIFLADLTFAVNSKQTAVKCLTTTD